MKLFFSGRIRKWEPEHILAKHGPSVMLTYYEIHTKQNDTIKRLERHQQRLKEGAKNARKKR